MAYRPPHRRDAPPTRQVRSETSSDVRLAGSSARLDANANTNANANGHGSRVRSIQNNGQAIRGTSNGALGIESAGGMRPARRLQEVKIDEMDMIQSISRSGGDGAEGDALKDYTMQSRFRGYIDERIDKHYTRFGTTRHTAPASGCTDEIESLSSIVLLFRKLREGVVASGRIDAFAIEVFESSVRLAILAKHHGQLMSSLSGLVPGLYQAVEFGVGVGKGKGKGKATTLDNLANELCQLGLSTTSTTGRIEFASIRLLYQLVQSDAPSTFHDTLLEITSPPPQRLHPRSSTGPITHRLPALIPRNQLTYALKASRALSPTTFDPIAYFTLLRDPNATAYERTVLGWGKDKVRDRAWDGMRKAYISTQLHWAGQLCGLSDGEEEWVKAKGASVVGTVVKLR